MFEGEVVTEPFVRPPRRIGGVDGAGKAGDEHIIVDRSYVLHMIRILTQQLNHWRRLAGLEPVETPAALDRRKRGR